MQIDGKDVKPMPGYLLCEVVKVERKSNIIVPDTVDTDGVSTYFVVREGQDDSITAGDQVMLKQFGERYFVNKTFVVVPREDVVAVRR